jgi:hypothetical protein
MAGAQQAREPSVLVNLILCQYDFDLLQTAAVAYLKKLDELHDDRAARLAADKALEECRSRWCGNVLRTITSCCRKGS